MGTHVARNTAKPAGLLSLAPRYTLSRDVFFEICKHLFPQDLLHLSRTSRALRRELRSRASRSLWNYVLHAWPGMPEITTWLNGPRFAWLAFEKDCESCGIIIRHTTNNFWALGLRLCNTCIKKELIPIPETHARAPKVPFREVMPTARAWSYLSRYSSSYVARPAQIEQAMAEFSHVPDHLLDAHIEERRTFVKYVQEHSGRCSEGRDYFEGAYEKAYEMVVARRRRDIMRRLCEEQLEIWDLARWDEMFNTGDLSLQKQPLFQIPKLVREDEWPDIKSEIVSYALQILAPLEAEHRAELLWQRRKLAFDFFNTAWRGRNWRSAPLATLTIGEFMDFPNVKEIVERPSTDYAPVSLSSFRAVEDKIHLDHEYWQDELVLGLFWQIGLFDTLLKWEGGELEQLWDVAPPPEIDWEEAEMYLGLATSVYKCTNPECTHVTSAFRRRVAAISAEAQVWPEVMNHECLRGRMLPPVDGAQYPTTVRWSPHHMSLHRPLQSLMQGIVRACGQDPAEVESIVMDGNDARLVCGICLQRRPLSFLTARTWWRCVLHYLNAHANDTSPEAMTWKRLSPEAEEEATIIAPPSYRNQQPGCNWRTFCTACPLDEHYDYREIHYRKMKKHWAKCHSDLMLDDGDRMWEKAYVPRIDEPRPVRLKTIHKRSGMTEFFTSPDDVGEPAA